MFSLISVLLPVFLCSSFLELLKTWKCYSGYLTKWTVLTFSLIHNKLLELEGPRKVLPAFPSPQETPLPDHKDGASTVFSVDITQYITMSGKYGRLTLNFHKSHFPASILGLSLAKLVLVFTLNTLEGHLKVTLKQWSSTTGNLVLKSMLMDFP